jgi:predicted ATPase/class 3 adenylate cyclase
MRELPMGTVTFLFSDIEGSTALLRELGDDYAAALAHHRELVRAACSAHSGVEVDTQGDAFFVAFARATDAVAAAETIQRDLASGPVRVRIGVHTGEPQVAGEGYVGLDVHRGARVCAAAHGGQVLLTQPTRDLVDVEATDLGEHRLTDLLAPQRLFQLGVEEFPPLRTLDSTNLPVQATPLVGRERELAEAGALLREQRFLTFVGPPGAGKTRLALQLAADAADDFEHVWWVGLQELHDPDLVEPTIAQTVGARADLAGHLRGRKALLLLDNVEHVLGCAHQLAELVSAASDLKLLATSREPLRITAEQQYPVPPLPDSDAVALFHERARAVRPDFAANGAVAEICRRLDGLPLAIELAAARVKLLAPDALLDRLEQRLPLLTGGARDLPERQRTLRATIEWSYDLLEPHERDLLARLSVFAGGWTLDAAEAVCDCDLDTLASLVDKSLVREGEGRFSMLETIREFARERLTDAEAPGQHAAYYFAGAEANVGSPYVELDNDQMDWFESEHDNVRTALEWLHGQDEAADEMRLAIACADFWFQSGFWIEAQQRLETAFSRADDLPAELRSRALIAVADFAWHRGDYPRGKALAEEALALHAQLAVSGQQAAGAYITLAICEERLGNRQRAVEILEQTAEVARAEGDEHSLASILNNLGNFALDEHDFGTAKPYLEESAAMNRKLGRKQALANNFLDLGFVALAEDRVDEARAAFGEGLAISRPERIADSVMWAIEGVAAVALERSSPAEATRLLATTTRTRAELGFADDFYVIGDDRRAQTLESARAQLGEAQFEAAWAEGEALSLDEAAEQAADSLQSTAEG